MLSTPPTTAPCERTPSRAALWRVSAIALLLSAVACVDTDPPDWWDGKREGVTTDSSGLTAVKAGQRCTPEEASPPPNTLRLHFVDVGQGDAIWVQSPTGENVLIDAGDGGFYGRTDGGTVIAAYLAANGFVPGATFDAMAITHAHSDHYGGFDHLLRCNDLNTQPLYGTAAIIDPGSDSESYSYGTILECARRRVSDAGFYRPAIPELVPERGRPVSIFGPAVGAWLLQADMSLRLGGDQNARVNNTSLVFRLSYAGRHFLLMADAHSDIELELIQRFALAETEPKLDANLIKVGHHGSTTSTSGRFVNAAYRNIAEADRYAVIMSGRLSFGGTQLPSPSTVHLLSEQMPFANIFSTEAGDDLKAEDTAARDDNILAVVRPDGSMYVCYR